MTKTLSMQQIIKAQRAAAKKTDRAWWFGPDEMAFFDSRIESEAFVNPAVGPNHYFVTSEKCSFSDGSSAPRLYSVRIWSEEQEWRVETWGKFQQFETKEEAIRVAERLGTYGVLPPSEGGCESCRGHVAPGKRCWACGQRG